MYKNQRRKSVQIFPLKRMVGSDESLTLKSKIELHRLPPCKDNLIQHIKRVNHRLCILKGADEPILECPKPYDEGQDWLNGEKFVEPKWSDGPVLPATLTELVGNIMNNFDDVEENSDFEDMLSDDDTDD